MKKSNPEYIIAPMGAAESIIKSLYPKLEHRKTLPEDDNRKKEKVAIALNFPKIKK